MTGKIPHNIVIQAYLENEAGDAQLFVHLYRNQVVFDHSRGEWYTWAGHYWQHDLTGTVFNMVSRNVAAEYLEAAAEAKRSGAKNTKGDSLEDDLIKRAGILRTRRRIENILFLAARLPGIALTGDEWDRSSWLLAVENGVLDLRCGQLRDGVPNDFIRTHAPVKWEGIKAACPHWSKFQEEICSHDTELIEFKQRLFGYSITGHTTEHVLPILWGEGRNGKSTELEILGEVLGRDLSTTSDADTLMDTNKSGSAPQPFIYALRGKRLVWAKESNEGRRINAGLVKQLTGGDTLTVRDMYSRPVTFSPSHTVLLITNNRPHMSSEDTALWDRVILIPYEQRFIDNPDPQKSNEHKQDRNLRRKLSDEKSGILAWLVRGCLDWQKKGGLEIPQKLIDATKDYRNEEDSLKDFVEDRCLVDDQNYFVLVTDAYAEYRDWAIFSGLNPMSLTAFGLRMKKKYSSKPYQRKTIYMGITLANNKRINP